MQKLHRVKSIIIMESTIYY